MSTPNVYNKRSPPSQNSNSEQKAGNEIEEQAFPALLTVLPTVKPGKSSLPDLFSLRQWSNPQVWKAGVSPNRAHQISTDTVSRWLKVPAPAASPIFPEFLV